MPIDITKFSRFEEVERSKRGDHKKLVDLLRSDDPLPVAVRDYLASELEKPPRKRFIRQVKKDYDRELEDRKVVRLVVHAKLMVALEVIDKAIANNRPILLESELGGLTNPDISCVRWPHVSDSKALDWLYEAGIDWIDQDEVLNALERRKRDKTAWYQTFKQRPLLTLMV